MHLYLIRHGQSYTNLKNYKPNDPRKMNASLTELGQAQSQALAEWMLENYSHIDILYSSPLKRSEETAQYIAEAYQIEAMYDDRIREIGNNYANHDPIPDHKLPKEYAKFSKGDLPYLPVAEKVENGESYMDFRARVSKFLEDIVVLHENQLVVVVCHGGVINAAFDHIFNIPPRRLCDIRDENTGITHFQYMVRTNREPWSLHCQNRIEHLRRIQ